LSHFDSLSLESSRLRPIGRPMPATPSAPSSAQSGLDFARHLEVALDEQPPSVSGDGWSLADYRARPVALHPDLVGRLDAPLMAGSVPAAAYRPVCAADRQSIDPHIQAAAERYDLPPGLIRAVIRAESGFDPRAVSPAGARGLMQLMPATAEMLGVGDAFDIGQNIDGGARYLRRMLDRFDGDPTLALAAYNAGPEAVARFGGTVPPFRETTAYVNRVLAFAAEYA